MPSHPHPGPNSGSRDFTADEARRSGAQLPRHSGDGAATADEMPRWAGDGRKSYANPMMPMWKSGDSAGMPVSEDLVMQVNAAAGNQTRAVAAQPTAESKTAESKASPTSDTWKLVCLVVVFLVWLSTASTLLFLYMDRYLFPG